MKLSDPPRGLLGKSSWHECVGADVEAGRPSKGAHRNREVSWDAGTEKTHTGNPTVMGNDADKVKGRLTLSGDCIFSKYF